MKYKMPTFEFNDNWVAVASQKQYLSVYFCNRDLIAEFKEKYPHIATGKACLNIKDRDDFPIEEIEKAIKAALTMEKESEQMK